MMDEKRTTTFRLDHNAKCNLVNYVDKVGRQKRYLDVVQIILAFLDFSDMFFSALQHSNTPTLQYTAGLIPQHRLELTKAWPLALWFWADSV